MKMKVNIITGHFPFQDRAMAILAVVQRSNRAFEGEIIKMLPQAPSFRQISQIPGDQDPSWRPVQTVSDVDFSYITCTDLIFCASLKHFQIGGSTRADAGDL